MKTHPIYYLGISNGDYNDKCRGIEDLANTIEFEMEKGGSKYAITTMLPLTGEAYMAICDILDKKESYERIVKAI